MSFGVPLLRPLSRGNLADRVVARKQRQPEELRNINSLVGRLALYACGFKVHTRAPEGDTAYHCCPDAAGPLNECTGTAEPAMNPTV